MLIYSDGHMSVHLEMRHPNKDTINKLRSCIAIVLTTRESVTENESSGELDLTAR
jgi:hypothetical protein